MWGYVQLARLERANRDIEKAIKGGTANEAWLRQRGYLKDGTSEYIAGNPRRVGFRQLLFPYAYTGSLFPDTVRKSENKNNKTRIPVDTSTYQALILLLPGIGFEVSVSDTVAEKANTFNKGFGPEFDLGDGNRFRALASPTDITLNGMAGKAPYVFGSRRGTMAMMRNVHLIMHVLNPHLKIVWAGRSQGGLISKAYAQTHNDYNFVAAIANNPTYPTGDLYEYSNSIHCDEEKLKEHGLDDRFHVYSWRSYHEFTPQYADVVTTGRNLVPVMVQASENDRGYRQPDYMNTEEAWTRSQPGARFEAILGAGHHFWSRPIGDGAAAYSQSVTSFVTFLTPHVYPQLLTQQAGRDAVRAAEPQAEELTTAQMIP